MTLHSLPQPPGRRKLVCSLIISTRNEKAWVAVLVARPTLQASRIAHPVETSNAEAHADM